MLTAYKKPTAPTLTTAEEVAEALGVSLPKLTYLVYALEPQRRYRTFEISCRSGRKRSISTPIPPLKKIQKALSELLAPAYVPRIQVQGYVNGRSPLTNADVHKYQTWVLHVDIRNFFPSISKRRIRGMFRKFPFDYSEDVAELLAQICTHSATLPQGAPTSPLLSNFLCRSLDARLAKLASENRCLYSRYCDDMTFSTARKVFPASLATIDDSTGHVAAGEDLVNAIESEGFYLRAEKTNLHHRTQRQMVTGLTVNEFANIPRHYVRSLRNLLFVWKKYGRTAAQESFDQLWQQNRPPRKETPSLEQIVQGRVQYVGAVKGWFDPVYRRLATSLADVDSSFSPTDKHSIRPKTMMIVHCEGKSDVKHLFAAWGEFKQEYPQLELKFTDAGSDAELLKRMETFASIYQTIPSIGLFDRDNERMIKRVQGKENSFRRWARGVYSLVLPTPPHREAGEPLCIELMHTDRTLSLMDEDGRRVFKKCEFKDNGFHADGLSVMIKSGGKQLIATEVRDIVSEANIALSKDNFATRIAKKRPPFDKTDLSAFQLIFDNIRDIRQQWLADRLEPF